MKISSRTEYLRRIDRVVAQLSAAIADEVPLPSVADLARGANLSEFHFMRVYRALAGESLGATIQRLRLSRSVHLLTQTSVPISTIAGRVGFETPQAFARAFRQVLNVSPSEARDRSRQLATIAVPKPQTATESPVIRVEVVDLQPFRAVALRNFGDYADLDQAYARLFAWLADRATVETVRGIWGVPHHDRRDTPAAECIFDCCLATPAALDPDDEVTVTQLAGGWYASCCSTGSYELLDAVHDGLLREVLLDQDLPLRDAPILHEYLNDPESTVEAQLETRVYLPIGQREVT